MATSKKSPFKGWGAKEVLVGDRLPYSALVDENVLLMRDGSVMLSLMVPGLAFETADTDELNAHVATREVLLRSTLDARFVMYHHVIRRRVEIELDGHFEDPLAGHIDARWRARTGSGRTRAMPRSRPIPLTCARCAPPPMPWSPRSGPTARGSLVNTKVRPGPVRKCSNC